MAIEGKQSGDKTASTFQLCLVSDVELHLMTCQDGAGYGDKIIRL